VIPPASRLGDRVAWPTLRSMSTSPAGSSGALPAGGPGSLPGGSSGSVSGGGARATLRRLVEIDGQLAALRRRRGQLPERGALDGLRAAQLRLAAAVDACRAEEMEVARRVSELEGRSAEVARHARVTRERLYGGAAAPRELEGLDAELRVLEARQQEVDDELLDRMERAEELAGRARELAARAAAAEEERAVGAGALAGAERAIDEAAVPLLRARASALSELPPQLGELYSALARRYPGTPVALVEAGRCSGCHTELAAAARAALQRDGEGESLPTCEWCGRLLLAV
jgi:predicted  nucleic acid-binding Zn-ribbon protein